MLIGIVTIEGYHCYSCPSFLVESGIDAIDPDCFGYDEYGNWDPERLGLQKFSKKVKNVDKIRFIKGLFNFTELKCSPI